MPSATTKKIDWTEKFDPEFGIIRWDDWAKEIIAGIKSGDATAEARLLELTTYLDDEYDQGLDALAVEPLTDMRLGWEH